MQTHTAWQIGRVSPAPTWEHKRMIFSKTKAVKADTSSSRKRESALPVWTEIFLYKHRGGLAITIKGKSPKTGEASATAQLCQHCRAAQRPCTFTGPVPPSRPPQSCLPRCREESAHCCSLRGGQLQLLNKAEPHHIRAQDRREERNRLLLQRQ